MGKRRVMLLTSIFALALLFGGCGTAKGAGDGAANFGLDIDDNKITVTANKADDGSAAGTGSLTVGENEKIVVEPNFEEDTALGIMVIPADVMEDDVSANSIKESFAEENAVDNFEVYGTTSCDSTVPAGEYYIYVKAVTDLNGDAVISVQNTDYASGWEVAGSADEAAQGAGIGTFTSVTGVETSLGTMEEGIFRFQKGAVEHETYVGAVQVFVMKGDAKANDGDVSFDDTAYTNEWTQDVGDLKVTCFGDEEGRASKTIWTQGDYCYAIVAYGMGGDDTFGFEAGDVETLVKAVK